ncbi:MAG: hypothetical protein H6971_04635 [Gammaproteobacteria bacterium]|nr:hypothetical protein [Gammaproteobacteria bacterium]
MLTRIGPYWLWAEVSDEQRWVLLILRDLGVSPADNGTPVEIACLIWYPSSIFSILPFSRKASSVNSLNSPFKRTAVQPAIKKEKSWSNLHFASTRRTKRSFYDLPGKVVGINNTVI